MARFPRHSPDPWLRSVDESLPPKRDPDRRPRTVDLIIVTIVAAVIVAMAVWFLLIAHGGPGPGTV